MNIAEADLRLWEEDAGAARACLERVSIRPHDTIPVVSFQRQVYLAEISLLDGQAQAALEILAPLEAVYRREGNIRRVIRLLGVKAGVLCQLWRTSEAAVVMQEAVRLAAPEGYLNVLLRAPRKAAALLYTIQPAAPEFIDQALALLAEQPVELTPESAPRTVRPTQSLRPYHQPSVEPLSEQEQKILRLLAAGRSNQEIAEALVISTGTVKWHVHNILQKMEVTSRSQAAAKARDLGLA
jgi:LuxR family maltose regulon positive regulatory protein